MKIKAICLCLLLAATGFCQGEKKFTKTDSLLWQLNRRAILYIENRQDPAVARGLSFAMPGMGNLYVQDPLGFVLFFGADMVLWAKFIQALPKEVEYSPYWQTAHKDIGSDNLHFLWAAALVFNRVVSSALASSMAEKNNKGWQLRLGLMLPEH